MKVIVGLGNPGIQYERTRHNAGFLCLDCLAANLACEFVPKRGLHCYLAKVSWRSKVLLLVKPDTYMNKSGEAIAAVVNWYKIATQEMLVVHDDVSLPLGKVRFQRGGGAGGQHGVESIIENLGGVKNFQRLKIGVGPDPGGQRRADYVLSCVPDCDRILFDSCILSGKDAVLFFLEHGLDQSMNYYNGLDLKAGNEKTHDLS